jgi:soluble lytic murein transglycosylase
MWGIGAALIGAAALAVSAATAPQAQSAFAAGYLAYQNGDMAGAIRQLQAADSGVLADYRLFYLAQAQLRQHDLEGAAANFTRLAARYPESVCAARAELAAADIALTQNQPASARQRALSALARSDQGWLQAAARLTLARAMAALGDAAGAYAKAEEIRRNYPRSDADAGARALQRALLRSHPELADTNSLAYLTRQAQTLLSEGQTADAYRAAAAALALQPAAPVRAAMLWVQARSSPANRESALKSYLSVAPSGPKAAEAMFDLARIYWHRKDTAGARTYFRELVAHFPESSLAPGAMLRIGRTYEDDNRFDLARSSYLSAAAAHPNSEAAADARFRAVWLLYREHRYSEAAAGFQSMEPKAGDPIERSTYQYWYARSLEQAGHSERAHDLYDDLAASTVTNYYPELAARRVGAPRIELPAAALDAPAVFSPTDRRQSFHLQRALALKALALGQLELGELRQLAAIGEGSHAMRLFLLAEYPQAGGYHDATVLATRMAARGEISSRLAERIRYPRAFWPLFSRAAASTGIKPYLLLALARQESLFDPMACSYADARGLMQLLPATARKVAAQTGMAPYRIDLYDPTVNIELGSANLKLLLEMFGGDEFKAIAAYNGGEDAVRRWIERYGGADDEWVENIEFAETRNYVKKVVGGMREYQMLYPELRTETASN